MELQVTGKNLKLTPKVHQYIERKLGKLGRRLSNVTEFKVEVSEEKTRSRQQRFVAQVTVESNRTLLRSENQGENLLEAIDKVTATTERQIERYKGKRHDKRKSSPPDRGEFSEKTGATPAEVVKVKRFTVKPMPVDEAIEQMELLGHDFFMFLNYNTEKLNLLYQRKDGKYGLIEPDLE